MMDEEEFPRELGTPGRGNSLCNHSKRDRAGWVGTQSGQSQLCLFIFLVGWVFLTPHHQPRRVGLSLFCLQLTLH